MKNTIAVSIILLFCFFLSGSKSVSKTEPDIIWKYVTGTSENYAVMETENTITSRAKKSIPYTPPKIQVVKSNSVDLKSACRCIRLKWECLKENEDEKIKGYNIYISTKPGYRGYIKKNIWEVKGCEYTIKNLKSGTRYYVYATTLTDVKPLIESRFSEELSVVVE